MVIDSSVLVSLALREPGSAAVHARMVTSTADLLLPSPMLFEASMVVQSRVGGNGPAAIRNYVETLGIEVLPFTPEHAAAALDAFRTYGKGRHPARLNFGDCMAYAVSKVEGEPLLFVGEDFRLTDVEAA